MNKSGIDVDIELLETSAKFDIGIGDKVVGNSYLRVHNEESLEEDYFIRISVFIHFNYIIAAGCKGHVLVGDCEGVVCVFDSGIMRVFVVCDIFGGEATQVFGTHETTLCHVGIEME